MTRAKMLPNTSATKSIYITRPDKGPREREKSTTARKAKKRSWHGDPRSRPHITIEPNLRAPEAHPMTPPSVVKSLAETRTKIQKTWQPIYHKYG